MDESPGEKWIGIAQEILRKLVIPMAAFALGAWVVYQDASVHPPADTTTSGIGVLLMGYLPVQALDIFSNLGGKKR